MMLANRVRRVSRMPFSLAKCPILLRAQPTSSIRQSFGKGGAVSLPSWARGEGQAIGRHTFYSPYESGGLEMARSIAALGDPLFSCARPEEAVKLYGALLD